MHRAQPPPASKTRSPFCSAYLAGLFGLAGLMGLDGVSGPSGLYGLLAPAYGLVPMGLYGLVPPAGLVAPPAPGDVSGEFSGLAGLRGRRGMEGEDMTIRVLLSWGINI